MTEMVKIVLNGCYGGFGLSREAVERYAEIKGWSVDTDEYDYSYMIDEKGEHVSHYDLDRTDPVLVQVVEELGEKANDSYSALYIVSVEKGTKYYIDEYDGIETFRTPDNIDWLVA
jgi:hypothetical protein